MLHYTTNIFTQISPREWLGLLLIALAIFIGDKLLEKVWKRPPSPLSHKLSLIYSFFIIFLTLFTRETVSSSRLAWTPLWSWREVLLHHNLHLLWQILLNILLFFPLGGLLALHHRWSVKAALCIGGSLSLGIEVCQLVFCLGLFEWDDILHNGIGCILGFTLVRLIIWAIHKRKSSPSCSRGPDTEEPF